LKKIINIFRVPNIEIGHKEHAKSENQEDG